MRWQVINRRGSRTERAIPIARKSRRPLESRMVLSVETTLQHPRRGFIKLENNTVAVRRLDTKSTAIARMAGTARRHQSVTACRRESSS